LLSRLLSRATSAHALLVRMRSTDAVAASAMTVQGDPPPGRRRHRHSSRRCMCRWEAAIPAVSITRAVSVIRHAPPQVWQGRRMAEPGAMQSSPSLFWRPS
jgi:hypothetical protein